MQFHLKVSSGWLAIDMSFNNYPELVLFYVLNKSYFMNVPTLAFVFYFVMKHCVLTMQKRNLSLKILHRGKNFVHNDLANITTGSASASENTKYNWVALGSRGARFGSNDFFYVRSN